MSPEEQAGMPSQGRPVELIRTSADEDLQGAARVWAAATSARDAEPEPAPVELARQVLDDVLRRTGSVLVVAHQDRRVVGFALAAPHGERSAEIHYLGVDPEHWGAALGEQLVSRVCHELAALGHADACLWVYADNDRAVRLYERSGWTADPTSARRHARSNRVEVRYQRTLR